MFTIHCTLHKSVERVNCLEWSCPGPMMLFRPVFFTQKSVTWQPWSLLRFISRYEQIGLSLIGESPCLYSHKPYANIVILSTSK